MDTSTREAITWTLGTIVTVCVIIGLAVRFVLMPYLREHLITPVKQVEKQVTENHHSNAQPTVLDRIDDVQSSVEAVAQGLEESRVDRIALRASLDEAQTEREVLKQMLGGHLEWSERWVDLIERELDLTRRENAQPPTKDTP